MKSTDKKRQACELFIAAIFQSASDIALDIASEVSANGDAPSLTDQENLLIFSSEWSFAKLAWLSRRTHEIRDPQLRTYLSEIIDQKAKALADVTDDDPMAFVNYYMLADAFDKGERDPVGLPMGPGPIIGNRYKRAVARFKDESFDPSSYELLLIVAAGDSCCWTLDVDLNDGLEGIINALAEEG